MQPKQPVERSGCFHPPRLAAEIQSGSWFRREAAFPHVTRTRVNLSLGIWTYDSLK